MGSGGGEKGERQNGRKSAVHDGRRNVLHDKDDALVPRAFPVQEAVHNVRAKVDAEADRDDEHAHGGDVDGEAPPVHET